MKLNIPFIAALSLIVSGAPVTAQTTHRFVNPCERGPIPRVDIINNSRLEFVGFLQRVYPTMERDVAEIIAIQLCDDMGLVGDSVGLNRRLSILVNIYHDRTN